MKQNFAEYGVINYDVAVSETVQAQRPAPRAGRASYVEALKADSFSGAARHSLYRDFGKRALDVALVLVTLPASVTIIAIAAFALLFEGGNPFYRQVRLGLNGKRISILKLRTMVRNADAMLEDVLARDPALREEWNSSQKLKKDPRITKVGAFLRSTSLDELPQIWNVLCGDMSLVGPRPMMPEQLPLYGDPRHYFALRPGITGLWQVTKRNESPFVYRVETDATYDMSVSLPMDATLLFKTISVVFQRTGV